MTDTYEIEWPLYINRNSEGTILAACQNLMELMRLEHNAKGEELGPGAEFQEYLETEYNLKFDAIRVKMAEARENSKKSPYHVSNGLSTAAIKRKNG